MFLRRIAAPAALLAALLALLTSCGLVPAPKLSVTPTAVRMLSNSTTITVSNVGPSNTTLDYTVTSSDPSVTVSPASGSLASGLSTSVTVSVDPTRLAPGTNLAATVSVGGNGGNANVHLDYGIGTCGTFTPQAVNGAGLTTTAIGTLAPPQAASAPAPAPSPADAVPGQIIVGYRAPAGVQGAALSVQALKLASVDVRRAYGLTLLHGGYGQGPDLVRASNVAATLARLRSDPRVRYAQPNRRVHELFVPNDPYYPLGGGGTTYGQWNLYDFGMPQAWDQETGASAASRASGQVVIGILDSGVAGNQEDLASKLVPGWDFYYDDAGTDPGTAPYSSGQDHGTHVAGIAAALGNNGKGIAGVAFDAHVKILPLKVFDDTGSTATVYDLVRAIEWAAGYTDSAVTTNPTNPNKADVINMSVGVQGDQPAVDAAAQDAWNAGVLLVAAAGNHGNGTGYPTDPGVLSPANAPCVMAVGSVDSTYARSYFSNTGPQVEVTAPGGFYGGVTNTTNAIVSTLPGGTGSNYGFDAGTSMASPFVAGIAALLKAQDPTRSPTQLRTLIDGATKPVADRSQYGYGVACADKALGAATTCGK